VVVGHPGEVNGCQPGLRPGEVEGLVGAVSVLRERRWEVRLPADVASAVVWGKTCEAKACGGAAETGSRCC